MGLEALFGVWKLLSLQFVTSDGAAPQDMYGADPQGYIFITPDHRMMTVITANDRSTTDSEAALFQSMMAYSGPFRIEGEDQFITDVEVSWHPGWVGGEQARSFSIEADILSITTAETLHPRFPGQLGRGVLRWQRTSAL